MEIAKVENIQNKILSVRGLQVMLDSDLAAFYVTETKFINRAVKRNASRFPREFMFQLTELEWKNLKYQFGTSSDHGGRRTLPYVFTEQGIAMLSAVLNTDRAIAASIQIMRAFVTMRQFLINNASIFERLNQIELKQLKAEEKFDEIFKALESGKPEPDKGIFFDGQIFDAYLFFSGVIKKAKKEIILMDNYVDETTITHLSKKSINVKVTIYTKSISKQLALDIKKANEQFSNTFAIEELQSSHDRFLIIDGKELYHIGASLKDLGKKWFAFSKMDNLTELILSEINI